MFKELIVFIKHKLPYRRILLKLPASFAFCFVSFGEKEAAEWPRCFLQISEEQKGERGAELSSLVWQTTKEWFKAAPGEV